VETQHNEKIKVIKDIAAAAVGISIFVWLVVLAVEISRFWIGQRPSVSSWQPPLQPASSHFARRGPAGSRPAFDALLAGARPRTNGRRCKDCHVRPRGSVLRR
jgi:hypothetical protein